MISAQKCVYKVPFEKIFYYFHGFTRIYDKHYYLCVIIYTLLINNLGL